MSTGGLTMELNRVGAQNTNIRCSVKVVFLLRVENLGKLSNNHRKISICIFVLICFSLAWHHCVDGWI